METTDSEYIQLSEDVISGNKWAFEIDLEDIDTSNSWNHLIGSSSDVYPQFSLRNATTDVIRLRNDAQSSATGTSDTSNIVSGKLLIVSNSSSVFIYHNGELFDTIVFNYGVTFDIFFNSFSSSFTEGYKGKASNTKIWDLSAYTSGQIDVLDFDTLAPTNWFALNEYDEDLTLPATKTFYDKMGTGVTGVLTNGSDANISKMDGLSSNFRDGFATTTAGGTTMFPRLEDESGYAGTTGGEGGFTAYLSRTDQSEQNVKAIETAAFIAKDAAEVFFNSGVAQDVNLVDITSNDYITKIKNAQNVITDLRIKA